MKLFFARSIECRVCHNLRVESYRKPSEGEANTKAQVPQATLGCDAEHNLGTLAAFGNAAACACITLCSAAQACCQNCLAHSRRLNLAKPYPTNSHMARSCTEPPDTDKGTGLASRLQRIAHHSSSSAVQHNPQQAAKLKSATVRRKRGGVSRARRRSQSSSGKTRKCLDSSYQTPVKHTGIFAEAAEDATAVAWRSLVDATGFSSLSLLSFKTCIAWKMDGGRMLSMAARSI